MEKHSRGYLARADRESRIQEKEKRKINKENRYLISDLKYLVFYTATVNSTN